MIIFDIKYVHLCTRKILELSKVYQPLKNKSLLQSSISTDNKHLCLQSNLTIVDELCANFKHSMTTPCKYLKPWIILLYTFVM